MNLQKKKAFYILALATMILNPMSAQQLKVKNPTIDVGQVVYREPVTVTFELTNAEHRPIAIDHIETSCGCATVDMPTSMMPANAQMTLTATYDAKQMGHFEKYVYVTPRGKALPLVLTIKGVVVSEVSEYNGSYTHQLGSLLTDKNAIDFGDVVQGDNPYVDIHVQNPTETPLSPVIMHQPSYLISEISPTTIPPGKTGVVRIMFASQRQNNFGEVQTRVYLGDRPGDKVNNNKIIDISALLLPNTRIDSDNAQNAPRLQMSMEEIDFGDFDGKSKNTIVMTLENVGNKPLNIHAVQMYAEGLKVSLPKRVLKQGEHAKMKITGDRNQILKSKQPYILMVTNDPQRTKVILPIKAKT